MPENTLIVKLDLRNPINVSLVEVQELPDVRRLRYVEIDPIFTKDENGEFVASDYIAKIKRKNDEVTQIVKTITGTTKKEVLDLVESYVKVNDKLDRPRIKI